MNISKNKPSKQKRSNKASQEFLKQSEKAVQEFLLKKSREGEEAILKWQQTALDDPFLKFQIASKKLDELKQSSVCLDFLFTPEATFPDYSDLEEFRLFRQTRHPRHLAELVKRECQQLDVFLANLDEFKSLKFPALQLFVLPDSYDHLTKWWEGFQLHVNRNVISRRLVKKGVVELFREEVKQLTVRIKKVKRAVESIRIGRPKKPRAYTAELNRIWETFRDKGMKALKPRYRVKKPFLQRLKDLDKLVKEALPLFSHYNIDDEELDKLNYHFKKREPLLKAVFGCMIGINSERKIKPHSIVKEVDRLIKSKSHELGR